jgi:flagellar motor protein MotB
MYGANLLGCQGSSRGRLSSVCPSGQTTARRSRSALPTTETELKLIAAAAMMGEVTGCGGVTNKELSRQFTDATTRLEQRDAQLAAVMAGVARALRDSKANLGFVAVPMAEDAWAKDRERLERLATLLESLLKQNITIQPDGDGGFVLVLPQSQLLFFEKCKFQIHAEEEQAISSVRELLLGYRSELRARRLHVTVIGRTDMSPVRTCNSEISKVVSCPLTVNGVKEQPVCGNQELSEARATAIQRRLIGVLGSGLPSDAIQAIGKGTEGARGDDDPENRRVEIRFDRPLSARDLDALVEQPEQSTSSPSKSIRVVLG